MYKKWTKKALLFTTFLTIFVIVFNFVIDPFQYYRKPTIYPAFFNSDQRYLNIGLAKNYTYDSIILGTSMTEQFRVRDANKILDANFLKLSMSGSTVHEQALICTKALKYQNVKNVIWGVDLYSLSGEKDSFRNKNSFPLYLYDDNFLNDIKYLLNIQTTFEFFKILKKYYIKKDRFYFDIENMFLHKNIDYEKINAKSVIENHKKTKLNAGFNPKKYTFEKMKENFDFNILPIIKSNKSTKFYIFLPPYSILAWKQMKKNRWLENALKTKIYMYEKLKKYPNAYLFDFQADIDFITNLNNYMDATHYKPHKNIEILNTFKNMDYTKKINQNNDKIKKIVKNW